MRADNVVRWSGIAFVLLMTAFLFVTDRAVNITEDEVLILNAAVLPVQQTLELFLYGNGQHEHPPLSDIALHEWLRIAPAKQEMLRLPFLFLNALGLWMVALTANMIAGRRAYWTALSVGVMWPFGFHFGRLLGWYTPSFFLVAWLTLCFIRLYRCPRPRNFAIAISVACLLVCTNYAGILVLALLFVALLLHDSVFVVRHVRAFLLGALALTIPIALLLASISRVVFLNRPKTSVVSHFVYSAYAAYAVFVGEAIAPWFLPLALVAGIGIVVAVAILFVRAGKEARRYLAMFAAMLLILTVFGVEGSKRVHFFTPWLLLSISVGVVSVQNLRTRTALVLALVAVSCIGWFGIFSGQHYSAPRFVEPWREVAQQSIARAEAGSIILAEHPVFLFYLETGMARQGHPRLDWPLLLPNEAGVSQIVTPDEATSNDYQGRDVRVVLGAQIPPDPKMQSAEEWLETNCISTSQQRWMQDRGYAVKQRLFPNTQPEWRILVHDFHCPSR